MITFFDGLNLETAKRYFNSKRVKMVKVIITPVPSITNNLNNDLIFSIELIDVATPRSLMNDDLKTVKEYRSIEDVKKDYLEITGIELN